MYYSCLFYYRFEIEGSYINKATNASKIHRANTKANVKICDNNRCSNLKCIKYATTITNFIADNINKIGTSKAPNAIYEAINQLNKKIHRAENQEDDNKVWWRKMKLIKLKLQLLNSKNSN